MPPKYRKKIKLEPSNEQNIKTKNVAGKKTENKYRIGNFYVDINNIPKIYLNKLLCTKIYNENDWHKIFECQECTTIGQKISDSLIKGSIQSIFSDPVKSINEIIINAVDSYSDEKTIGKFGMGFFSIFYWLIGNEDAYININTCYKENNKLLYYLVTIIYKEISGIEIEIKIPPQMPNKTGTRIILNFGQYNFVKGEYVGKKLSQNDLSKTIENVYSLKYYENCNIKLRKNIEIIYEDVTKNNENVVHVDIRNDLIIIEDNGKGISLDTLLNSLLIPSSSTKRIPRSIDNIPQKQDATGIYDDSKDTSLIILVGGIPISKLELKKTNELLNYEFVADLPLKTSVTVARDDIIFDEETIKIFKNKMKVLFKQSIDKNLIYLLQILIKDYEETSTQNSIQGKFTGYLDFLITTSIEKNKIIPCNPLYFSNISKIFSDNSKIKPVTKNCYHELENYILNNLDKYDHSDIFKGNIIIFTEDNGKSLIENFDVCGVLFVSKSFKNLPDDELFSKIKNMNVDSYTSKRELLTPDELIPEYSDDMNRIEGTIVSSCINSLKYNYYFFEKGYKYFEYIKEIYNNLIYIEGKYCNIDRELLFEINVLFDFINLLNYWNPFGNSTHNKILDLLWKYINIIKNIDKYILVSYGNNVLVKFSVEPSYNYTSDNFLYSNKKELRFEYENLIYKLDDLKPCYNEFLLPGIYESDKDSVLSSLLWPRYSKNKYTEHLKYIIKITDDVFLYFVTYISYKKYTDKNPKYSYHDFEIIIKPFDEKFKKSMDLTVKYIKSKFTHKEILLMINDNNSPKILEIVDYIENISNYLEKIEHLDYVIKDIDGINLSKMISCFFRKEYNFDNYDNILNSLEEIKNDSKDINTDLQFVEIAINEGTSKNIYESVITELVQNSIDATRNSHTEPNIHIDIFSRKIDEDKIVMELQIVDHVGMNFNNIISLCVPYLSGKQRSPTNTGEMGNGFFNVYRNSTKVEVITKSPNTDYKIIINDKMIRENNRVVDIKKDIEVIRDTKKTYGTAVIVQFLPTSNIEYIENYVHLCHYIQNAIGVIDVENLNYKKIVIDLNSIIITQYPNKYKLVNNMTGRIYNKYINSYILTKEIPFIEVSKFLHGKVNPIIINLLKYKYTININDDHYKPTQSRTKLKIEGERKIEIEILENLLELYYINFMKILSTKTNGDDKDKIIGKVINNYYSEVSDLKQLIYKRRYFIPDVDYKMSERNYEAFFISNYKYKDFNSINGYINSFIKYSVDNEIDNEEDAINFIENGFNEKKPRMYEDSRIIDYLIFENIKHIVINWFIGKYNKKEKKEKTDSKIIQISSEFIPNYIKIIKSFIEAYCEVLPSFENYKNIDVAFETDKSCKYFGSYNIKCHKITISLINIKNCIEFLKIRDDLLIDNLENNEMYKDYFGLRYPTSIVVHELEHARRRGDSDYHIDINEDLGDGVTFYTFEDSALLMYKKAIKNGLIEKWKKKILM